MSRDHATLLAQRLGPDSYSGREQRRFGSGVCDEPDPSRPGIFLASARRVTFMPMLEVLRRLSG
jgi:hypothetical protein